jgi:hypothetical protein
MNNYPKIHNATCQFGRKGPDSEPIVLWSPWKWMAAMRWGIEWVLMELMYEQSHISIWITLMKPKKIKTKSQSIIWMWFIGCSIWAGSAMAPLIAPYRDGSSPRAQKPKELLGSMVLASSIDLPQAYHRLGPRIPKEHDQENFQQAHMGCWFWWKKLAAEGEIC